MYLLNFSGVMFGSNASLDLGGSFHVSTADYLRLGENERFYTMPHENETLSVAVPAAFGFLDSDVAPVTVEGRGELTTDIWDDDYGNWWNWLDYNEFDYAGLVVPKGETISVVGGDIDITGTYFQYEDEGDHMIRNQVVGANLDAPEGQISLVSIRSEGEVGRNAFHKTRNK